MSLTQPVADFYEVLGPFYEFVSPDVKSESSRVDSLTSSSTGTANGKVASEAEGSARMPFTHTSGGKLNNFRLFFSCLLVHSLRKYLVLIFLLILLDSLCKARRDASSK